MAMGRNVSCGTRGKPCPASAGIRLGCRQRVHILADVSIWAFEATVDELNAMSSGSLIATLGIEVTEITAASLKGRMPVDARTTQPAGVLHGGASVALAETLASWAGYLAVDRARFHVVGQEINANHIRPVSPGAWVFAEVTPAAIGRRSHVWEVRITNEAGKLVCISRCTLAVIEMESSYAPEDRRGS